MKIEYAPLLPGGFLDIGPWQFDQYFLEPFSEKDPAQRKRLIDQLLIYLEDLATLGIPFDVWIDGSFATKKPDPDDVDLVVWVREVDTDSLPPERLVRFRRLVIDREWVRAQYGVDVYMGKLDNPAERKKWQLEFGFDRAGLNPKGIFTLTINHV